MLYGNREGGGGAGLKEKEVFYFVQFEVLQAGPVKIGGLCIWSSKAKSRLEMHI